MENNYVAFRSCVAIRQANIIIVLYMYAIIFAKENT